jgi:predicted transposase/invertase (TIGR01784 family)
MARHKTKKRTTLDPGLFLHQPHDKYARFVLQVRAVAIELIQYCVPGAVLAQLDLDSLALSDDSFVDVQLRVHFSDICYTGKTVKSLPFRITIVLEHKSEKPDYPVLVQLHRYISNVWSNDIRQGQPISLTIPILIYHGSVPLTKDTPATLFMGAPEEMLPFVPQFDYIMLDLSQISSESLENLHFLLLRNILLALKQSRNNQYVDQYWQKIVIFAAEVRNESIVTELFQATVIYLNYSSSIFNQKLQEMEKVISAAEQTELKPFLQKMYEQWLEKGMEKGIEKGMEKGMEKLLISYMHAYPEAKDSSIAQMFDIPLDIVVKAREKMPHQP